MSLLLVLVAAQLKVLCHNMYEKLGAILVGHEI